MIGSLLTLALAASGPSGASAPDAARQERQSGRHQGPRKAGVHRQAEAGHLQGRPLHHRDRAPHRPQPDGELPARPPVSTGRALRREEPVRVLPPGRATGAGHERRDGQSRDASAQAEGGAALLPAAARVPGLPRRGQGHLLPGPRAARARPIRRHARHPPFAHRQVPEERAAAGVRADSRRLLVRQGQPRRGGAPLPGHPAVPALAGARPGPVQDGVDSRQPAALQRCGRLLRGGRWQPAASRASTRPSPST